MDFLIFIVVVAIIWYLNQKNPAQTRAHAPVRKSARGGAISSQIKQINIIRPTSNTSQVRPNMSPLLGIEITMQQQRLLGKNDPSVIAANLNKSSPVSSWLDDIKETNFDDLFSGHKNHSAFNTFFEQLFNPKK